MIEFTGYLTANALKYYQRRSIRLTRVFLALLFSMCVSGLFYANFWFRKQISAITAVSAIVIFAVCIIFLPYPIFKWQKSNSLAKQIYIKDGMVFYVTDKGTVTQALEGVKGVRDFGEYYVLIFRGSGNFSQIICEKDLLTKGTIEQFEELFDGKIMRMQSN